MLTLVIKVKFDVKSRASLYCRPYSKKISEILSCKVKVQARKIEHVCLTCGISLVLSKVYKHCSAGVEISEAAGPRVSSDARAG